MGHTMVPAIQCDECDAITVGGDRVGHNSVTLAKRAQELGWLKRGIGWYCPVHRKRYDQRVETTRPRRPPRDGQRWTTPRGET